VIIKGKAIKYGDDVNTDVIIPGRYLIISNPNDLAVHTMEDLDDDFFNKFKRGDIIVAGRNFGCGSSREQAAICLKYAGVGAIIAKSFARIFYRNAINQGIPIVQSEKIVNSICSFDELEVDFNLSRIVNKTKKKDYNFKPLPDFIKEIISHGGLVGNLKKKMNK